MGRRELMRSIWLSWPGWLWPVLALALMVALSLIDRPLRTPAAPWGIVSLEFARTRPQTQSIVDSWNSQAQLAAALSLGLDYLFMPAYALTLAGFSRWAGQQHSRTRWLRWGERIAWLPLLAAGADALENIALWRVLQEAQGAVWPALAWGCATLKFICLLTAGLFILWGVGAAGRQRLRGV